MAKTIYECTQKRVPNEALDILEAVINESEDQDYRIYDAYLEAAELLAKKHKVTI